MKQEASKASVFKTQITTLSLQFGSNVQSIWQLLLKILTEIVKCNKRN